MTDVKRLLDEATPLPWIRPWGSLNVHAPGTDDIFGRLVPSIHHPGSLKAQANIDLAVYAVNRLPDYEAAVDALERIQQRMSDWRDATQKAGVYREGDPDQQMAKWVHDEAFTALRRLRLEVPA